MKEVCDQRTLSRRKLIEINTRPIRVWWKELQSKGASMETAAMVLEISVRTFRRWIYEPTYRVSPEDVEMICQLLNIGPGSLICVGNNYTHLQPALEACLNALPPKISNHEIDWLALHIRKLTRQPD